LRELERCTEVGLGHFYIALPEPQLGTDSERLGPVCYLFRVNIKSQFNRFECI